MKLTKEMLDKANGNLNTIDFTNLDKVEASLRHIVLKQANELGWNDEI